MLNLTTPTDVHYILGVTKWFWMPMPNGKLIRAVAVTSSQGASWVAAYTLLLILIFVAIARILKDIVIGIFPLRGNGNRYAMLVGYYNTNDPVSIILIAASYCWKILCYVNGDGLWGIDWETFWLGVSLIVFALAMLTANAVGGVLVPGNLRLGKVARVRPDSIYYPAWNSDTPFELTQRFLSPQAFGAAADFGRLEATLRSDKRIIFHSSSDPGSDKEKPSYSFNYSYSITGYELGLQRAPSLNYTVIGSCKTEYDWRSVSESNATRDVYRTYPEFEDPDPNQKYLGALVKLQPDTPYAEFLPVKAKAHDDPVKRYSIIPHTAGRQSPKPNMDDPWYMTGTEKVDGFYSIKSGRPALGCEHREIWQHGGKLVYTMPDLKTLSASAGLKLSGFLRDELFVTAFFYPAIITVANNLGNTALDSSLQYIASDHTMDASILKINQDLERLVLISLLYSREVVRSTAHTSDLMRRVLNLPNKAAANGTDVVPDDVADFVLDDGDITTMSVKVLIATPAVCLLLWIFIGLKGTFIFTNYWRKIKNDSFRARYTQRTIVFSAIQLYRYLDEELSGERRWKDRLSFYPFVEDANTKYTRRHSEFEVAPISAQVTTPTSGPIARYSKASYEEDAAHYFSSDDPGFETVDQTKPLVYVTPFARPALVPLHQRSFSSPESSTRKSFTSVSSTPSFSFSAANRRPTSHYITHDDKFELAMTRHWRPSLRPDDDVRWSQVQRE